MADTRILTTVRSLTIGWTRSDMDRGYSSFNGYEKGASQHTEQVRVAFPPDADDSDICEDVFIALNAPDPSMMRDSARRVLHAIEAINFTGEGAHYSLSVGDTVTVHHDTGDRMYACENLGWRIVR